jgi:hypothetical protein
MWQIIRKQTRPNTNVPFFGMQTAPVTDEFKTYWQQNYILTDKLIYMHNELSEDSLELFTTIIWDSRASVDAFEADTYITENLISIKRAWMAERGITEILVSNAEV